MVIDQSRTLIRVLNRASLIENSMELFISLVIAHMSEIDDREYIFLHLQIHVCR